MANFKTFSRISGDQITIATIYDGLMGKSHVHTIKAELRGNDVLYEAETQFPTYFRFDMILGMLQRGMA